MPTRFYTKFQQAVWNKEVDMDTDVFRLYAIGTGYTPNYGTDEFFTTAIVPAVQRLAFVPLTITSIADANWEWAPATMPAIGNGVVVQRLLAVWWTGTDSTSRIALSLEGDLYPWLPFTGNGGTIPITFPTTGDKVASWNA